MSENELSEQVETVIKRGRGRPKTGFDKKEYVKEYTKKRNKKVLEEKGEDYEKSKIRITEYNARCREAYKILRDLKNMKDLKDRIPQEEFNKIIKLFDFKEEKL